MPITVLPEETRETKTRETMEKALQTIDDQIARLQKLRADIQATFLPERIGLISMGAPSESPLVPGLRSERTREEVLNQLRREGPKRTRKDQIIQVLRHGQKLRRQIASETGMSKHTLNSLLSREKGLFRHDELGFWSLVQSQEDQSSPIADKEAAPPTGS